MIVAYVFIECVKPMMTYTDDAMTVSSNVECHHSPRVWEQLAGNEWQEAGYTCRLQAYERHSTKMKILITQAKGQWAAHDTLPQALRHNLMVAVLFKNNT